MPTSSTQPIRIDFDQHVPMRDGVTLSVDVYRPAMSTNDEGRFPVILLRTPYLKANELINEAGKYFAERGFV
ncbi:MAG TPA: CocE/NonD family hydrolase, partial [Ktedonobacteraceae bacterium]|nr:CocE/NonD family hydrolase [Ktedonobacteraceae bacterium]